MLDRGHCLEAHLFATMKFKMFTGIIKERAEIRQREGSTLTVHTTASINDIEIGDSVSINGVCLTAARLDAAKSLVSFDLSDETLDRTNLSALREGHFVNLEPSLSVGDKMGGHWVQGHVDTLAEFCGTHQDLESELFKFNFEIEFEDLIVEKGSIAIDGISLTPYNINDGAFDVAVVPHTLKATTLQDLVPGDKVNIEFDILGKYIKKQLRKEA